MRIIKNIICVCLLAILCTSTWCDEPMTNLNIEIHNMSSENIFISEMLILRNIENVYSTEKVFHWSLYEVSKNKILKLDSSHEGFVEYYQINVYKHSTFEKYTRQELIDNNICDKVFVFTYDELKALNFRIIYTGNE